MTARTAIATAGTCRLTRVPLVLLLAALVVAAGCSPPPRPPLKTAEGKRRGADAAALAPILADEPTLATPGDTPLLMAIEAPFDLWDAYYFGGEQIGYSHIHGEPTDAKDEVRYRITEHLETRREGELLKQVLKQTTLESTTGQLKRFDAELLVGDQRTHITGRVQGNQLVIATTRDGETTERSIPWKRTYGGLLARDQQLRENPLRPGQTRRIKMLAPLLYELGELEIQANGNAAVPLLSGPPRTLLECESTSSINGNPMLQSYFWCDDEGNVLKTYIPSLQLTILRVDELTATSFTSPESDLLAATHVPVDKAIDNSAKVTRAGYQVAPTGDVDLAAIITRKPGQVVRPWKEQGVQVAVIAGIDSDANLAQPAPGDRNSNPLVQSNDPLVKRLAATAQASDPMELATILARTVHGHIHQKDLSTGFASAASVAASGQGDCTEHAVLLAAMCRSRGIPARLATGLVYDPSADEPQMRFHMWTLAHVGSGWVGLDAMNPSGLAAADRITLATDDLSSGNEFALVAPVQQILGNVRVEVAKTQSTAPRAAPESAPENAAIPASPTVEAVDELLEPDESEEP